MRYYQGWGVLQDIATAAELFEAAAKKGDPMAQFALGKILQDGIGVPKNEIKAVELYEKSAAQGNAFSQTKLGTCYLLGIGVDKDQAKAVDWFRKAAEQDDAEAMFGLGLCYVNGHGVPKDIIEGYAYLNLASINESRARKALEAIEYDMSQSTKILGQQRTKQLQKEIQDKKDAIQELQRQREREKSRRGA
jgi:hypothetical protein